MKVGGGLNYVVGPMGAGKSLYGVRKIVTYLLEGRYVVTNVELREDAFERIVRRTVFARPWSFRKRQRMLDKLRSLYIFETDLAEAVRYRVPGTGEARALFCWDETHNDLNNREWKKNSESGILTWGTQLRKLGFVGFLLAQHADNTDAALRRICNFQIRLQNQRENVRIAGMRLPFMPRLFLAAWYPAHLVGGGTRVTAYRVDRYFLGYYGGLYDTWGLFHGIDESADPERAPIYLGDGGGAVLPAPAGVPATAVAAGRGAHRDVGEQEVVVHHDHARLLCPVVRLAREALVVHLACLAVAILAIHRPQTPDLIRDDEWHLGAVSSARARGPLVDVVKLSELGAGEG